MPFEKDQTQKTKLHVLITIWLFLVLIGILMSMSAPSIRAEEWHQDPLWFFKRHLLYNIFGLCAIVFIQFLPIERILSREIVLTAYLGTTALLVLVLFTPAVRDVHRWLRIGPLTFQPSELAKLALILYVARKVRQMSAPLFRKWYNGPLYVFGVVGVWGLLIFKEPDLGNMFVLILIAFFLLFITGVSWRFFAAVCVMVPILIIGIYQFDIMKPYMKKRIDAYLHPEKYAQNFAFQQIQSRIALGSGGLFGVGFLHSIQKLYYLPESHHDYVFAILGEEFGFIGTTIVVLLYGLLLYTGHSISKDITDSGYRTLVLGISIWLPLQGFLNMSVVTGLLPPKGMVLPFISYGGSSLLIHSIAIGLLIRCARHSWLLKTSDVELQTMNFGSDENPMIYEG